jgi:hypothetical protein
MSAGADPHRAGRRRQLRAITPGKAMENFAGKVGSVAALVLMCCGLLVGAVSAGPLAVSQEFSAELIGSNAGGEVVGKPARFYVADRKVRIETADLPDSFLLVDSAVRAAYLVRPAQRVFMDAKQSSRLTRLFIPLDPANPCPQWQIMAEVAGITDAGRWHCDAREGEIIDGRSTLKYVMTSGRGRSTGWIDPQLGFPLKIETEQGDVLALRNIQEAPQPRDKFEIPSGYRKLDPRWVIEQMRRSDIWAGPPDESNELGR